ncbi:hypothetical protein Acr_02g0013690 [Actinidia rufa]|uniref:Reverse transcriptase domain-containing protein n=1 Tax=Actinidia rufa TaxID=165716 RepID=A0A7J0EB21_9ERIC|nr:hypothetical protein Acr_02g0013690 [Actinidia rufa]
MSKYFAFGDEELSCFPVWVRLPNLPLSLWGNESLSRICSKVGNPISVDKFTATVERFSYARALVEIDMAKEVVEYVEVELPNGKKHCQYIYYENLPKYCTNCAIMGHSVGSCKVLESIQEKKAMEKKKQAMGQTAETGQEANKGEHSEWVTKKGRSVKGQKFKLMSRNQGEVGVQGRVQGSDEVPNNQAGSEIRGGKGVELSKETTTPEIGQTSSGLNQPSPKTKIKRQSMLGIVKKKFRSWQTTDNFQQDPNGRIPNGRIMILWQEDRVSLEVKESSAQVVGRRQLWDNLSKFNSTVDLPWLLMGDFNNVLNSEEKTNGLPVSPYEMRDFQRCCYELSISDLRHTGLHYTWTNNSVWSKLDRAMVNIRWVQEGLKAVANFGLPGKCSDHSPCVVTMFDIKDEGARPFKFFNMWAQHFDFLDIVSRVWGLQVHGTEMYKLCRKLKALKLPLKELNKLHFSHLSARAAAAEEDLLQCQQMLHDNPRDELLQNNIADLRKKATRLAEAELSYCSQLAKSKFIKNSDRGTKIFHDLIKSNKARNQIVSLSDANGDCQSLESEFLMEGSWVSDTQGMDLIRPVADEEIKAALYGIGDDKAPGLDGYSACFFKKSWSIIGEDVCLAIKEFFMSGNILNQINHAIIALVPKSANATRVEDFRPISCCNVVYKIISKILASRLSPILESLIDPAQSAFVPNRSMVENIYMVQELLRKYTWNRISPRCIMKVDLRKAKLGRLKRILEFKHHPKCLELSITHLAFADDLILFTRGDAISVKLIMECLKQFGNYSGLCVNASKSCVFMAGICTEEMEEIETITGFSKGEFPFRYLGIPVAASRLTINQFSPFISKISEYINAWAGATLSNFLWGGKATGSKRPLVAWKDICRPKPEGGLGFMDLNAWNWALLAKALWNLQSKKDTLWVKWINQVYMKNTSFWDYTPSKQDSQMVRQLSVIRDKIIAAEGSRQAALDRIKQWAAIKWISKEGRGTGVQAIAKRIGIACVVYCLWKHRNTRMFEGKLGVAVAVGSILLWSCEFPA